MSTLSHFSECNNPHTADYLGGLPDSPEAEMQAAAAHQARIHREMIEAEQDRQQLADEAEQARAVVHVCSRCRQRFSDQPSHYQHIRKSHRRVGIANAMDESRGMTIPHVRADIRKYA